MRTAPVILAALVLASCGGDSSRGNPAGPAGMGGAGTGMGNMPGAGMGMGMQVSSEYEYLAQMIPHHEEAVMTATLLQRGTERPEMRAFAATIIRTQSAEIEQMKAWLAAWYPGRDTRVSYVPMMRDLTGLSGSALDRAFLEDMIPHHMMAVMMSQRLLTAGFATRPEVVPFARTIRDTQRQEIATMSAWLREWFGVTGPMGGGH